MEGTPDVLLSLVRAFLLAWTRLLLLPRAVLLVSVTASVVVTTVAATSLRLFVATTAFSFLQLLEFALGFLELSGESDNLTFFLGRLTLLVILNKLIVLGKCSVHQCSGCDVVNEFFVFD